MYAACTNRLFNVHTYTLFRMKIFYFNISSSVLLDVIPYAVTFFKLKFEVDRNLREQKKRFCFVRVLPQRSYQNKPT